MSEYTKGPWRVLKNELGHEFIEASNGDIVSPLRSSADARLIAAAPDLLEALEAFLNWYVHFVNSGDAGFWDPEKDDIVIKARSALSKAKGET